jgi:hypothetical protein
MRRRLGSFKMVATIELDPYGFPLLSPERSFDLIAYVPDVSLFKERVGRSPKGRPAEPADLEFRFLRGGYVPDEWTLVWWRRMVRLVLGQYWGPDDAGFAENLCTVAEQLLTREEADQLQTWAESEFGDAVLVEQRHWWALDSDDWMLSDAAWHLRDFASYTLPFNAVMEPMWVLRG